ncbi:uncharacterized protein JN550_008708 [Neoarthrinium moseri]|uniref:uncharacterized protein n=1 Tax=Neoarthrinium moseri TaxID=1658444 RepID=UPI001FDB2185|nr:uncharacterized protein JN550_008708 [Neoarthrinium moseri]KAI1864888.1 hypothetical protein JN550_008708 [Neoarthrinium moseri]
MSLTTRLTSANQADEAEDFLADSLGVVFPDDVMTLHGDASNALRYTSPHLPKPLHIQLADPDSEDDRRLFGHYLWNSSLMLAEFVEAGALDVQLLRPLGCGGEDSRLATAAPGADRLGEKAFDVRGLDTIELGAGTALPSIMASLLGAKSVVVTDYPAPPIMEVLHKNVAHNTQPVFSPSGAASDSILVDGHAWGQLDTPFARARRRGFDRVFVCDCLWMPWQHANLRASIDWFMKDGPTSRAWIVAGFHTGRQNMSGFFNERALAGSGLEVERIWERDCDGAERAWATERKDDSLRKRWMVVAVLRRLARMPVASGSET